MPRESVSFNLTVNKRIKTAIQSNLHIEDAEQIVLGQEVEKLESVPAKNPANKIPTRFVSKEENMVKVMFRALSAHRVDVGTRRQMNFGAKEGVLRRSMGKLLGRPIMTNHSWNVDNIKGHVEAVSWDEGDGNNPAGINALLAVDGERHPVLANNLASGRIKAVSVTVEYSWEYSHKELAEMPEYRACRKLGTKAPDGTYYERLVTKIHAFHEISFVFIPADATAVRTDKKGKPERSLKYNNRIIKQLGINPNESYQLDENTILTGQELAVLSSDLEPDTYIERVSFTKPKFNTKQMDIFQELAEQRAKDENLKLSAEQFETLKAYIPAEYLKDSELENKVSELKTSTETLEAENIKKAERITELEAKLSESEDAKSNAISEKESLATKLELAEELAEHGKTWLAQERTEVLKAYTTAMALAGATPKDDRIDKIKNGNPEFLSQCRELYGEALKSIRKSTMSYNKKDTHTNQGEPVKETRAQKRKRTARSARGK